MRKVRCLDRPEIVTEADDRVRLLGPLDAFSARAVEDDLGSLAVSRPLLTVDLTDVEVLTSGGLAMLERCRTRAEAAGCRLRLQVRPDSIAQRVLEVVGSPDLVPVVDGGSVPAALPEGA